MNKTLEKLTAEKKAELIASIASKATIDLFASMKSATDEETGSFKVIISTSDIDRQGESVNQAGWDLSFYKMNPVVLWAHDYSSLPIGMAKSVELVDGKLVAEGKFAPASANPFAQQVRKLYELGMINATSVGFIPKEFDQKDGVINKSELLEFSFVPVPANAHALRLDSIKKLGLDLGVLSTKGINIKEAVAGDGCEIDGKPGQLQSDPKNPDAPLVCVAKTTEEGKGQVADELQIIETKEEKYEKYCELMEAIDAFCTVYFDEATPVENFSTLLLETIEILKQIAANGGADDDLKSIKEAVKKMIGDRKSVSETTKHNAEIIKSAMERILLSTSNIALGKKADGNDGGAGDGEPDTKRSNNSEGIESLNDFVENRNLLRSIDNSLEKVLRSFNQAAKNRSKN